MSLTGLAFAAAFFGALGLALFRSPLYGLYAYVAVFYLHPPSRWWGEDLPDLRWALLAALVTLIATLRLPKDATRDSWISTTPAKLLLAYTAWLWIQNLWALDADDQMTISILFTKYLVLFYFIYRLVDTPQKVLGFLLAHIAGCAYLGWVAFNTRVSGGRLNGVGGPGIDEANALAMQMGTGVAIAAMIMLGFRGRVRWAAFAAMPFLLNTMVLAGSRGAFLALLVAGLMLWYLCPPKQKKMFYAFGALGVVLFSMLASDFFLGRVETIGAVAEKDAEVDRSAESRIVLAKAQLEMAASHPFGTGHRGTAVLSTRYLDPIYLSSRMEHGQRVYGQRSSHNTFLTALVEQGIVGLVLYLWTWLWVIRTLIKLKRAFRADEYSTQAALTAAIGGALIMVFAAGQFVDYLKAEVQVWLIVILSVLLQLERTRVASASKKSREPSSKVVRADVALPSTGGK